MNWMLRLGLRKREDLGMVARVPSCFQNMPMEYGIPYLKPEDVGHYISLQMSCGHGSITALELRQCHRPSNLIEDIHFWGSKQ